MIGERWVIRIRRRRWWCREDRVSMGRPSRTHRQSGGGGGGRSRHRVWGIITLVCCSGGGRRRRTRFGIGIALAPQPRSPNLLNWAHHNHKLVVILLSRPAAARHSRKCKPPFFYPDRTELENCGCGPKRTCTRQTTRSE